MTPPEALLINLPIWKTTPELRRIEEGRTNSNFFVRDGDASYFGRVGTDLPHHGISRSNETLCVRLAAKRDVSPRVHFAGEGVLITEFVVGETLSPGAMHNAATLRQTADVLRRLHAEPANDRRLLPRCGVAMSLAYLKGIPDADLPVPRDRIISRIGSPSSGGDRLVHCDIIPENLIRVNDRLLLIDWEYGGVGIPEIDLASVIANADLNREEAAELLSAYGPHDKEKVEQQRIALVVREALWCLTQIRHSGPKGDLVAYTQLCVERMLSEF
ncbi:phosphotransferase family protein (plasmid) [Mesorhizobium sp. B2-1-8]|uniref:choline/ethanolamine kinase family protein n=1 Tax=Mesorhizobium sp. B2-1-8 TaxID=2589967 RepID=UPI00112A39E1|nr:choline/ethanolamine kinase family protein [Mesorhizobium sp. B2-1-8]UCI22774.1 phosphotransferase family protein [Mesorhizobium sp. B2-1-8]